MLTADLLELQRLDTTTDQLRHRRAHLPERAALADATAARQAVADRQAAIASRSDELIAAIEQLEHDGTALTTHRTRLQKQLKTIIAPREAEALMHEIDGLAAQRDEMDDRELAHLEEHGELESEAAALTDQTPALDAAVAAAQAALTAAEAELDSEVAQLREAREPLASSIDASLLSRYEHLRERLGGVAVAKLEGTHCSGCHLDLSPGEVDEVRSADGFADCPQCGRLLAP